VGTGLLCVYSGWHGLRVGFDLSPLYLQATGTESVEWEERLGRHANGAIIYASTVADSADEVFTKNAAFFQALPMAGKV
jgi:hypothetical protein